MFRVRRDGWLFPLYIGVLVLLLSDSHLIAQGSQLDFERKSVTANISHEAKSRWDYALNLATRTGPNSAIFHTSSDSALRAAAEVGHPFAQYYLGQLYMAHALTSGDTIMGMYGGDPQENAWKSTDSEGIKWLTKSASQGVALAQWELWVAYKNGEGVAKDLAAGKHWLEKAAQNGLPSAQYEYGVNLFKSGQVDEGTKWVRLAAKQRYIRAVDDLYIIEAYKYTSVMTLQELTDAASSGDSVAMRVLGIELKPDGKFPNDLQTALGWELKAAESGDPVAEYNVGTEFWKGENRKEDDSLGFQWLVKSAMAGYPSAQESVGISYDGGRGVQADLSLAAQWYERAVSQGSYKAADNLGFMYLQGEGVPKNLVKAAYLFDIAARQGDSYGIENYMELFAGHSVVYINGKVEGRDLETGGAENSFRQIAHESRNAGELTWTDPATSLMWTKKDSGGDVNWHQAITYCRNLKLAGHSDWRLATEDELGAIYDTSISFPGTLRDGTPVTWHVKGNLQLSGTLWSSSPGNGYGKAIGFFSIKQGFPYHLGMGNDHALCVRHSGK